MTYEEAVTTCQTELGVLSFPRTEVERDFLSALLGKKPFWVQKPGGRRVSPIYAWTDLDMEQSVDAILYIDEGGAFKKAVGGERLPFVCYITERYVQVYSQKKPNDFGQMNCALDSCNVRDENGTDFLDFRPLDASRAMKLNNFGFKMEWDGGRNKIEW